MKFALEATLGIMHLYAAHTAVATLTDIRAQRWLAERMPAEMDRIGRSIFFPSPFGIWFDNGFKGEPTWRDHPVIVEGHARRAAHERTASVGYERGESVVAYETFGVPHDAHIVIDWLGALGEEDPRMLEKLGRVTWQQAKGHAQRWHERLAARRADGIAGDLGTVDRLDVEGMLGWYWVHLVTKAAFDREGAVMGHCVGRGGYDYLAWDDEEDYGTRPAGGIWSLRDPSGRSRVTVEVGLDGIEEAQGPENARPDAETGPAFGALIARCREPKQPFDIPHWLVLEKDGSTRIRSKGTAEGSRQRYRVGHGEVSFRLAGGATVELRSMGAGEIAEVVHGIMHPPAGTTAIEYTAPAVVFTDRRERADRQPWYRQHERRMDGRRPR